MRETRYAKADVTDADDLRALLDGGDPTLSVRGDMAEECWRIVAPVLAAWRSDRVALDEYEAGGPGPGNWPSSGLGGLEATNLVTEDV